jgi:hypothetical protein
MDLISVPEFIGPVSQKQAQTARFQSSDIASVGSNAIFTCVYEHSYIYFAS